MTTGVYVIEHLGAGKRYVGSAIDVVHRFAEHRYTLREGRHHSPKLQNAWRKYGEAAFRFRTLIICDPKNMLMYEQTAINGFDAVKRGYNCVPRAANSLGYKHTNQSRLKISAAKKLKPNNQYSYGARMSEATKNKIRNAAVGRHPSPETIDKLKRARVGKTPSLGLRHSKESKAKMSLARKGKPRPDVSAALYGRRRGPPSAATREKISASQKARMEQRRLNQLRGEQP